MPRAGPGRAPRSRPTPGRRAPDSAVCPAGRESRSLFELAEIVTPCSRTKRRLPTRRLVCCVCSDRARQASTLPDAGSWLRLEVIDFGQPGPAAICLGDEQPCQRVFAGLFGGSGKTEYFGLAFVEISGDP